MLCKMGVSDTPHCGTWVWEKSNPAVTTFDRGNLRSLLLPHTHPKRWKMLYNVGDSRVGKPRVLATTFNRGNLIPSLLPTRPPNTLIGDSGRGNLMVYLLPLTGET